MSSSLHHFLPPPTPRLLSRQKPTTTTTLHCSPTPPPPPPTNSDNSTLPSSSTTPAPLSSSSSSELDSRKKILQEVRRRSALKKAEPPNFQIGWKRTKEIITEKPKGWQIADFLEKLEGLMGRKYGSKELLAKVGYIVADRAREEAEVLREEGEVEDRVMTELYRLLKLLEMDMEMVKAAVKEETVKERVETAKARCRQAILVALSL